MPHEQLREQSSLSVQWLRQCVSRHSIVTGLKTLLWLAPLTLVIWVYAEREQIVSSEDQSIPIEVRCDDANRYVQLRMSDKKVVVQLSGPRAQIDEIRRKIQLQPALVISVDPSLSSRQQHELDTAQQLLANQLFARTGVTVSNCKPARLPIYIDEYVEREVDVQAPTNVSNLAGSPIFEPRRVKVRGPSHVISSRSQITVLADLVGTGVLDQPGSHEVPVRISSPQFSQDEVTYSSATVTAKFTVEVRQPDDNYTIPSIAIFVEGPQNVLKSYRVECDANMSNVTVIGPSDKIELLKKEDYPKPKAILEVSREDALAGTVRPPRRLIFRGLDEGVRVSPEDEKRAIEFKLVELPAEQ